MGIKTSHTAIALLVFLGATQVEAACKLDSTNPRDIFRGIQRLSTVYEVHDLRLVGGEFSGYRCGLINSGDKIKLTYVTDSLNQWVLGMDIGATNNGYLWDQRKTEIYYHKAPNQSDERMVSQLDFTHYSVDPENTVERDSIRHVTTVKFTPGVSPQDCVIQSIETNFYRSEQTLETRTTLGGEPVYKLVPNGRVVCENSRLWSQQDVVGEGASDNRRESTHEPSGAAGAAGAGSGVTR
jgi:hypothetical protein